MDSFFSRCTKCWMPHTFYAYYWRKPPTTSPTSPFSPGIPGLPISPCREKGRMEVSQQGLNGTVGDLYITTSLNFPNSYPTLEPDSPSGPLSPPGACRQTKVSSKNIVQREITLVTYKIKKVVLTTQSNEQHWKKRTKDFKKWKVCLCVYGCTEDWILSFAQI